MPMLILHLNTQIQNSKQLTVFCYKSNPMVKLSIGENQMRQSKPIILSVSISVALATLCFATFSTHWLQAKAAAHPLLQEQTNEQQAGPAMTLTSTVGTDPDTCATTGTISVVPGTTVYECFTLTNTGDVSITLSTWQDTSGRMGTFLFPIEVGQTVVLTELQPIFGAFVSMPTASTVTTATLSAFVTDAMGEIVDLTATTTSNVEVIGIEENGVRFAHTISAIPDDCDTSNPNASDSISVDPMTRVYSCVFVYNSTSKPITTSLIGLSDHYYFDESGQLPDAFAPLAPFIEGIGPGARAIYGPYTFTATNSIESGITVDYETGDDFSRLSLIANVDLSRLLHMPIAPNLSDFGAAPTGQFSGSCFTQATNGILYEFAFEDIPDGSMLFRNGEAVQPIGGSGTFDVTVSGADGAEFEFIIKNGDETVANCGSAVVVNPVSTGPPICNIQSATGTTYGFAFENVPTDSTVESNGETLMTISGNGSFDVDVSGEDGDTFVIIITNDGATIAECGTASVLNPPAVAP